jgi:hypothetical protein
LGSGTKQYLIFCSSVGQRSDTQMKDQSFLKLIEDIFKKRWNPGELISETPKIDLFFPFFTIDAFVVTFRILSK